MPHPPQPLHRRPLLRRSLRIAAVACLLAPIVARAEPPDLAERGADRRSDRQIEIEHRSLDDLYRRSRPAEGFVLGGGAFDGPLPIEDFFFLTAGLLQLSPAAPPTLGPGEWELSVVGGVGNDFAQSGVVEEMLGVRSARRGVDTASLRELEPTPGADGLFRIDLEYYVTTLKAARGFDERTVVELSLPVIDVEEGRFDGAIEGFHDLFSLNQAGRTGVPRNSVGFYLRSGDLEIGFDGERGKTLGDVQISVSRRFGPKAPLGSRFGVRATAKLPTASEEDFVGSGSLDLGIQLLVSRTVGRGLGFASFGAAYLGEHKWLDLDEQVTFAAQAGVELPLRPRMRFIGQLSLASSPFSDLGLPELAEERLEATLGVRYLFAKTSLFLGLTENVAHFNNSSDIGLSLGIRHRL